MRRLGMGVWLVLVLVVDTWLTLGSLLLGLRHGSSVTCTHVGRKASRQLCGDLKFIGVGQDGLLLLTGRGVEGVVSGITSTVTGRTKGLHIGRVDLSRILTARHGRGRAGTLQDGELSVLLLNER
jgi:hypothetical protein